MKHRGVAPAEEERMEFWIEGAGGGKVELHTGFLVLTHCNNRPLVSDAAEEGRIMLLEEVVAMFARPAKRGMPRPKRERGSDRTVVSQKPDTASLGVTPAMERMPASKLESKSRNVERLAARSETRARKPTQAEMHCRMRGRADQLGRRRTAGRGLEAFGDDGGGIPLAIFEGSGDIPRMMQPSHSMGKALSPVGGRMVPGGTRNRHL